MSTEEQKSDDSILASAASLATQKQELNALGQKERQEEEKHKSYFKKVKEQMETFQQPSPLLGKEIWDILSRIATPQKAPWGLLSDLTVDEITGLTSAKAKTSASLADFAMDHIFGKGKQKSQAEAEAVRLRQEIAEKEYKVASQAEELRKTAEDLRKTTDALQIAVAETSTTKDEREALKARIVSFVEALQKQRNDYADLSKRKDLGYLLGRICSQAGKRLIRDPLFEKMFDETKTCSAFVLSIDIRRSTDLMLRGKTPKQYAEFLNKVCSRLGSAIKAHLGVIDKFTGDGFLAYFPDFFTGKDAGYRALAAAQECHAIFNEAYKEGRGCFTVALKDVGLGIGIDFGEVELLRVTDELTVVGAPVVYACRLGGAPAGKTYMNHSALDELKKCKASVFQAIEVDFPVKNEGTVICYDTTIIHTRYEPVPPEWLVNEEAIAEKPTES